MSLKIKKNKAGQGRKKSPDSKTWCNLAVGKGTKQLIIKIRDHLNSQGKTKIGVNGNSLKQDIDDIVLSALNNTYKNLTIN